MLRLWILGCPAWSLRFWLLFSIKTDRSTYLSSVGVSLKIWFDKIFCCWMDGVYWGIYQWIWSIFVLASAIAAALSLAASSLFLVNAYVAFFWCSAKPKTPLNIILRWYLPFMFLSLANSSLLLLRLWSNGLGH